MRHVQLLSHRFVLSQAITCPVLLITCPALLIAWPVLLIANPVLIPCPVILIAWPVLLIAHPVLIPCPVILIAWPVLLIAHPVLIPCPVLLIAHPVLQQLNLVSEFPVPLFALVQQGGLKGGGARAGLLGNKAAVTGKLTVSVTFFSSCVLRMSLPVPSE